MTTATRLDARAGVANRGPQTIVLVRRTGCELRDMAGYRACGFMRACSAVNHHDPQLRRPPDRAVCAAPLKPGILTQNTDSKIIKSGRPLVADELQKDAARPKSNAVHSPGASSDHRGKDNETEVHDIRQR
jgi:hypothetical protein